MRYLQAKPLLLRVACDKPSGEVGPADWPPSPHRVPSVSQGQHEVLRGAMFVHKNESEIVQTKVTCPFM